MSTDLIPQDFTLTPSKYVQPDTLDTLVSSNDFLPYIQLVQPTSADAENQAGDFLLVKGTDKTNVGKEFITLPLGYRPKAMQFSPEIVTAFDPSSEKFEDIKKRSSEQNSGCGFGIEFLYWLPDFNTFALHFFSSFSARNETPNGVTLIGKTARISSRPAINKRKQRWQIPQFSPTTQEIQLPDWAQARSTLERFNNPVESSTEVAEDSNSDR